MAKTVLRVWLFMVVMAMLPARQAQAQCDPESIPYQIDFEDCSTGPSFTPPCWTKLVTANSYPYPKDDGDFNNTLAFQFGATAAAPAMAAPLNTLRISFDMMVKNTDNILIVGIVSDLDPSLLDEDMFVVDTLSLAVTNQYVHQELHFDNYPGTGGYIVFRHNSTGNSLTFIDNVVVSEMPDCLNPVNLTVSSVTAQSASLSWTEEGTATQWRTILSTTPVTNFNTQTPSTVNSTSYTASNLTPNTTYYFYVQSVCGDENSSWSSVTFVTPCAISVLPLSESFAPGELPACWQMQPVTGGSEVTFVQWNQNYTVFPYQGTAMALWASGNFVSGRQTRLVSSPVSTIGTGVLGVGFHWYHTADNPQTTTEGVQVQYSFDGTTWTDAPQGLILRYSDIYSGWTEYEVLLPAAGEHSRVYVGFLFTAGGGSNCYLDEVQLHAVSGCAVPANLAASNVAGNSATLSWTEVGTANSWQIVLSEYPVIDFYADISALNPTTVNTPIYNVTGLNPLTTYYAYVCSVCGGNTSEWSHGYSFTTGCGTILELPYNESFDDAGVGSDAFPQCWLRPATSYYQSNMTPSATDITAVDGPNSLMFCTGSNMQTYAITPALGTDIHGLTIAFFLYKEDANMSGTLEVGVMSNPSDYATFEGVATFNPAQAGAWQFCSVDFANTAISGTGRYIAFRHNGVSDFNYYLVDEVKILQTPSCWPAMHLAVDGVTGNEAHFSWTDVNETPATWNLRIADHPLSSPTAPANVLDTLIAATSYDINYLNGGTTYYYYVLSQCGGNQQGDAVSGQFTTLPCNCYMVINMFDSYGDGWSGAKIQMRQGSNVIAELTLESGASGSDTVYTCTANNIDYYYVATTNYSDGEVSFNIVNSLGNQIYASNGTPTATCFFSNVPACGVNCNAVPGNVHAVNVQGGARITWDAVPSAQSYAVYRNNDLIAEYIPGTSFVDYAMVVGENCYSVAATCIVGESNLSAPTCVVGIDDYGTAANVQLFPNPARDVITLHTDFQFNRLEICNMLGQTVWAATMVGTDADLATPAGNGVYFLKIWQGDQPVVRKFVVQH
ncbi:MAG: choice-of-anchor J domain-containing protein [Bacteroidales bacterium]|nr:choice-of-anchor J domain-containing protein [Bacteroidales bacterium]